MAAIRRCRQANAAPARWRDAVKTAQASVADDKRSETDLLVSRGVNPGSQRRGDELGSETDANRRALGAKPLLEQFFLVVEKWIKVILVSPDGPTKNDEKVWHQRVEGQEIGFSNRAIGDVVSTRHKDRRKAAQILEMYMA